MIFGHGIVRAAGRDWPFYTSVLGISIKSAVPGKAAVSRRWNSTTPGPFAAGDSFLSLKHWGCFLVLKLQVSNPTITFCHFPATQQSQLCCKTSVGQFGWKYGRRCLPRESSRPARIGSHLCLARKCCYGWHPCVSRFIIFIPKLRFS